jgi:hypothetical protein
MSIVNEKLGAECLNRLAPRLRYLSLDLQTEFCRAMIPQGTLGSEYHMARHFRLIEFRKKNAQLLRPEDLKDLDAAIEFLAWVD